MASSSGDSPSPAGYQSDQEASLQTLLDSDFEAKLERVKAAYDSSEANESSGERKKKRKRASSNADKDPQGSDLQSPLKRAMLCLLENHICPISQSLMVQPMVAEDGHLYEKAAIERWLKDNANSPKTNMPMGKTLIQSVVGRQSIMELIKCGVVEDRDAAVWYLETAKLQIDARLPGGADVALANLESAASLNSKDAVTFLVGLHLRHLVSEYQKVARSAGLDTTMFRFGHAGVGAMAVWRRLPENVARVRIIEDQSELERLCLRPAPGTDHPVKWNSRMPDICGKEYVVTENAEHRAAYAIQHAGRRFLVPFDGCILISEGPTAD